MDMPVNVPVDNPDADTEWNDILRKHGIIPERPASPTEAIQEALHEAKRLAHENRLEHKTLGELDELEDEEDEEFLEHYRSQRMNELKQLAKKAKFGTVYPLQKPDYQREVTEASKEVFVFVHLTSSTSSNVESRVLAEVWRQIAPVYGEVKFCEITADLCIEGYPERNVPTILVYKDTDIKEQIITLKSMNGPKTSLKDIEGVLIKVGAITSTDYRILERRNAEDKQSTISSKNEDDEDVDDWD